MGGASNERRPPGLALAARVHTRHGRQLPPMSLQSESDWQGAGSHHSPACDERPCEPGGQAGDGEMASAHAVGSDAPVIAPTTSSRDRAHRMKVEYHGGTLARCPMGRSGPARVELGLRGRQPGEIACAEPGRSLAVARGMNTTNKALGMTALLLGLSGTAACGGQVSVEETQAVISEWVSCDGCAGTATVVLAGLGAVDSLDPALDVDVCVGVSCGQALVTVFALPEGTYPTDCIADDEEVGCCFASPTQTMPHCSVAPGSSIEITMTLPNGTPPGATLGVTANVGTTTGEPVASFDGDVAIESCGERCVTGEAVLH